MNERRLYLQASISLNPDVLERSTVIFRPLRVIQSVPLRFTNTVLKKSLPVLSVEASFFLARHEYTFNFSNQVSILTIVLNKILLDDREMIFIKS